MTISVQDKTNYFKGLVVLIGKDKIIRDEEKQFFRTIGAILGFDTAFCDYAVTNLAENKFLSENPPKFTNQDIAKAFVRDGLLMGFADKNLHLFELDWLEIVAKKNEIDENWCLFKLKDFIAFASEMDRFEFLEIRKFL
ncbi:MAG: hypothetical protein K9I71_04505 [Ignavibacteriales bacterium]|nr:hypothetical protein [Ignavibacteriales bacterium]MCF8315359.1 hypothetical protein [Ignavibacteriales bacterium]MCF8436749.1 hypothetical protein [Ignavibacteriales bacterium]